MNLESEPGQSPRREPVDRNEARRYLRQQRAVAELGLATIATTSLQEVLDRAAQTAVETLEVPFAEILELDGDGLVLRAGVGWRPGQVGTARVGSSKDSMAGYTLERDRPLVIQDLRREKRFRPPRLLTAHGVVSGLTVVIRSRRGPWGVLGIQSDRPRSFSTDDIFFVQSVANVLTAALERQRMEEELHRSHAELALRSAEARIRRSERLASLGTLAIGIAHEINNPVSSILMTAEGARATLERIETAVRDGHGERLAEDLDIIMEEAERCGELVRKVLEFMGERRAERELTQVNAVVRAAADLAQTSTRPRPEEGHRIVFELADDLPAVPVDRADLEQALAQLVTNGLQAAEGSVTIAVSTRRSTRGVEITVRDDGPGVASEVKHRIFDPFFTTRRDRGAAGLGLTLAHRVVTDHGGSLDLESTSDTGSAFRIDLPTVADQG